MATHSHFWGNGHAGTVWMQAIAGTAVMILFSLGIYHAAEHLKGGYLPESLLSVGTFIGPALIYAFGFFCCLPDILRTGSPEQRHTLPRRWISFALLSGFFALAVIAAAYLWAIYTLYSGVVVIAALTLIISWLWVLSAAVVASVQYLDQLTPETILAGGSGWRGYARRFTGNFGSSLLKLLRTRVSLVIGAVLVLLSLALVVDGGIFSPSFTGYSVLTGRPTTWFTVPCYPQWPIGKGLDMPILVQLHRLVYGLGLLIALLGLVAFVMGSRKRPARSRRLLPAAAGAIALLQITEVALLSGLDSPTRVSFALAVGAWSILLALWFMMAGSHREHRDEVRVAVLVLYLPIFMIGCAWLITYSYLAPGFGAFVMGMLLLWWGFLQQQREARITLA